LNRAADDAKRRQSGFFPWLCLALKQIFRPAIGFEVGLFWLYLGFLASFFIIEIAILHR